MATIDDQVAALTARVNALDGQGLLIPSNGFTAKTRADISGVREDLHQSILSLEGTDNSLLALLQWQQAVILELAGLAGISPPAPPTITPPTT